MRQFSLAFLLGVLWVQHLPSLPPWWLGVVLLPLLWLCRRYPLLLPLSAMFAGAAWLTLRAQLLLMDGLAPELEGRVLLLEGEIDEPLQGHGHATRFLFLPKRAWHGDQRVTLPRRLALTDYEGEIIPRAGDHWRFAVKLKRPHGFQNPGAMDYEANLLQKRIRARGYVRKNNERQRLTAQDPGFVWGRVRQQLGMQVQNSLHHAPLSGLLVALLNGDRRGINHGQWEVLRRTGTSHLMAISGLHIGLVAGLVFVGLRRMWGLLPDTALRWPAPKAAAVGAMLAALFYAALAGFSLPTQRALIMLAVVLMAQLLQRRIDASTQLAWALLLVLLYDPLAPMAAGFWLSFAAVALILYSIRQRQLTTHWQRWWIRWGRVQWVLAIGLAPLTLFLFQFVSISAPVANLVAVPVFALGIVPLCLIGALALYLLPVPVATWPLELALWMLQQCWPALAWLAQQPYSHWSWAAPPPWAMVVAIAAIAWLLAPRGWPARWLGIIGLLPLVAGQGATPRSGEFWFTLLDVGQGLAAVVRTQNHVMVYDTGPRFSERFDTGSAVVLPYLRQQGINAVDYLIVSHGDNDHIGGAASVLDGIHVDKVFSSVTQRLPTAIVCQAGQGWHWDGVEFKVLSPRLLSGQGNNDSCVLHISGPHGSALLPGDIEASAEFIMLAQHSAGLQAEILVAPHHGSKTSSSDAFIQAVAPHYVLFPVGYRNRYRHPHSAVIERYRHSGALVYDSATHGALELRLQASGIDLKSYRQQHRRYWFK